MKTLQIVGNARYGGATLIMLEWSKYLLERNCQVDILCTDERMQNEVRQIPAADLIDHIFIPKEIDPFADAKAFWQLFQLMRAEQYDVVHTYTATPSFLGRVAATASRVPVVVNHQGGWAINETSSRIERLVYTPAEYIATLACTKNICVAHSEIAKAKALGCAPQHKLVAIVNGIDPTPITNLVSDSAAKAAARAKLRQRMNLSNDAIIVGSTSRLVEGKDNESLIQAADLLRNRLPNQQIALALVGDGDQKEALAAQIEQLDLIETVHLLGFCDDIPEFLAGIDIFATATLHEGLSIALLESMAAKLPIVATDIPANAEVVRHEKEGLLVPVKSATELADALHYLITQPTFAEQYATNAQQTLLETFTQERMFRETWDLYNDLLARKNRAVNRPMTMKKEQVKL